MTMQSLSTTTTELKPVELQSYLDEGWRIFVDTCSFMSSGCEPFFTRSAAAFRDAGVSIHCPKEVRRELEKNLSSPKEQTRQLAMRGLAAYDALDKLDVLREIDCPGSQENVFADPVFAKIFDEQRAEHKLLLITQDRRLAAGLYSRNQDEFMHFHPVHVLRLLSRGDLGFLNHPQTQELMFPPNMNDFSRQSVPMIRAHLVSSEAVPPAGRSVPRTVSASRTGDVREASRPEKESVSKVVSKPAVPAVEQAAPALHAAFPVCTSVIDLEDRPVGIDRAPVEGDVVCDEFGMTHTLGRRLGEGGEGIVYDAGNGMVAKIYHADKCTTRREAKVRLLASRPIRLKGVCAPQRMLFSNGFFAGCLMPEAKGFGLEGRSTNALRAGAAPTSCSSPSRSSRRSGACTGSTCSWATSTSATSGSSRPTKRISSTATAFRSPTFPVPSDMRCTRRPKSADATSARSCARRAAKTMPSRP
ncbi:MAG: hypothetical protein UEP81_04025 [Sutterella wadsworthensis]|nr:hypothetical protein [Sutterella wadsworthensis]